MKRRALLAHLAAHWCILVREGAKHSWWGNPANGPKRCSTGYERT